MEGNNKKLKDSILMKLLELSTIPVSVFAIIVIAIAISILKADVNMLIAQLGQLSNFLVVISVGLYVFAILITIHNAKRITKVITDCSDVVNILADGDLTVEIPEKILARPDELGDMGRATEHLAEKLHTTLKTIQEASEELLGSGDELDNMARTTAMTADGISSAVEDISRGSVSQAEDIETTSNRVDDMGSIISVIVDEVGQLDEAAKNMHEAGNESSKIMSDLEVTNGETVSAINRVANNVKATDESVQRISEAVALIQSIADQTNLLSLNASIEAARAGEAGKGFAVVATEIQKLSIESNESAAHIEEQVKILTEDSAKSMGEMESLQGKLELQQEKLRQTIEKFATVSEGIKISKRGSDEIAVQTKNCDEQRGSMIALVQNLAAISQENAANSEETTASMQELNATISLLADSASQLKDMAEKMQAETMYFKI